MTTRFHPSARDRAGNISVFAALLTIVFAAMVAFAVDLGYLNNSKTELQRTADAAALASASDLIYKGLPGTPVDLTTGIASAQTDAVAYARRNPICSSSPSLSQSGDVVIGYMANPRQPGATMTFSNPNQFNAVQVTVNRTEQENGKVPYFFAKVFGMTGQAASATATAALISNAGGFQIPSGTAGAYNLPILPFALDQGTYVDMVSGVYACGSGLTDNWAWDSSTNSLKRGCDGIWECNLFPQGTGSPGNRGTVKINTTNNSTSTVVNQILNGISSTDLATQPGGEIVFDSSNQCSLSGNPGISAGFKSALASICGQTRIIPIFSQVSGNGNNAVYQIVGWCGVRVCDVNLTGSMTTKYLTVQPARVYVKQGLVPNTSGTQTSYAVYSPVWLVK